VGVGAPVRDALLVALGGALGSVARWAVGRAVAGVGGAGAAPWATAAVNVLGCALLGVLVARVPEARDPWRLALGTGVLGGFTTFSTFGVEVVGLARENPRAALVHVAVNVVLGVGAAAGAWVLARR
jgi:CrcB protein